MRRPAKVKRSAALIFVSLVLAAGIWAQGSSDLAQRALPLNRMPFAQANASRDPRAHSWIEMKTAIGDDYFDGTSSLGRVRRHFRTAQELGVKYLRCGFSWSAIEKSDGVYDWRFWDMLVHESERAHIELMAYVAYTPEWAASSKEQFWSQPPRNDDWYAEFMYQAVSRYRGKVRSWEIWNEPDNREYWGGSDAAFGELVKKAAVRMRQADPSVVLVLGGMSRGPSRFFSDLLEKQHIDRYVDVIAMHGYPETWGEERVEKIYGDWVPEMTEEIESDGSGVDFWANELGYADFRFSAMKASRWGGTIFYDYEHTKAYAANFLFKSEAMALASGRISLAGWYRIDDFAPGTTHVSDDPVNFHLGLIDSEGHAKPAFYALQFFNRLFDEPVREIEGQAERPAGSQAKIQLFERKDGTFILIGWLRSSEPSEIRGDTGELQDRRDEAIAMHLPCRAISQMRRYDAEGHALADDLALSPDHTLHGMEVRGGDVFIATFDCEN